MYLEEVYLFTGTEQVIKKSKMDRILENLKPEETDIIKYDLDTISIQEVIADCMTIPFLKKNKVVIIKNPKFLQSQKTHIKHDITVLIKYLQNIYIKHLTLILKIPNIFLYEQNATEIDYDRFYHQMNVLSSILRFV